MSYTDGMDKTPGVRQHNRGWAKRTREIKREEAEERNASFRANVVRSRPKK